MNRIAGIFNLDQMAVDAGEINRMIDAMKFQGRDRQNIWIQGEIGVGCIHMGNLPGAHGDYWPAHSPNEPWVITWDGRIDNRRELLTALKPQRTDRPCPVSDEEIVLLAYEKWGLECPGHLIGDFAFAIWDQRNQQLLCGRDHLGVKPFYYSLSKSSLIFASTPQAVLASRKVPNAIHEERIADFLVNPLEGIDKTSSFYTDVFRLPPAHRLIVQAGGMIVERYWELTPTVPSECRTDAEYLESFDELFAEAVRCRLQNVSTPASMLSGGLDSSAIVGMGREILAHEGGQLLHAFAVVSNSLHTNRETSHISSVLDQGNLQPHLIAETELCQWMDQLVHAIEVEAEPFDCLMNLNRAVYLHARERGIGAVLDGVDGDVLLSGSGHLTQLWRQGRYRTIVRETLKAEGLIAEYKMGRKLFLNGFLSAYTPFAPDWYRSLRQPVRNGKAFRVAVRDTLIDGEFAVQSHLGERFGVLDSHSPRQRSYSQADAHKLTLDHPFLTVGLERYERVSSAFGVEARHPFADVRLVEFCLGLPWQLKTQHGWTKVILRRAMEPYLPSEVVWRKDKDSLMWEVNRMILKDRAEYFYQITRDEQVNLKPYVDTGKLMNYWQEYLSLGRETHAELIWSGVALAMWLRQHRTRSRYGNTHG